PHLPVRASDQDFDWLLHSFRSRKPCLSFRGRAWRVTRNRCRDGRETDPGFVPVGRPGMTTKRTMVHASNEGPHRGGHAPSYIGNLSGATSASNGAFSSFAESTGSATGQSMPIAASFQRTPASADASYSAVHWYMKVAASLTTQKPCATPSGLHTCRWLAAVNIAASHCPKVGEPRRMSTAT